MNWIESQHSYFETYAMRHSFPKIITLFVLVLPRSDLLGG